MRPKSYIVGKDSSVFLLAAIVLLLAGGIAFALYTLRTDPVEEVLTGDRVVSVLYIIEKDQKPLSSYVLMCYPHTGRAAIFDIPGELGLLIRRINRVDRIDTVYDPDKVSNFKKEIEDLLGVEITFSIVINLENLGKAVDLVEGVELFIPARVQLSGDEGPILFPSGLCRLDGDKAMVFFSYKAPDEDPEMGVFRRQRFFISFLKRQAGLNNALKNSAVAQMYRSYMQSDLNQRAMIRLLDVFAGTDFERSSIQSVGGNFREVSGKMLLIPFYDGSLIKDIVRQTLGTLTRTADGALSDRVFTVEVLNGTTVSGLAGRTAEILRSFGYDIISIGNADHSGYEKTAVIDRSGMDRMARNFVSIIRCGNISFEAPASENPDATVQSYEYHSDFTLIIGRDFNGRYVTGN
jgi:anionic cell wall polymer biosynthesis LytR-Cps2A-Psr (LCP) family protein